MNKEFFRLTNIEKNIIGKQNDVWKRQQICHEETCYHELEKIHKELIDDPHPHALINFEIADTFEQKDKDMRQKLDEYFSVLKVELKHSSNQRKKHVMLAATALKDLNFSATHDPESFHSRLKIFHHRTTESGVYPRLKIAGLSILSVIVSYLVTVAVRMLTILGIWVLMGASPAVLPLFLLAALAPVPIFPIMGTLVNIGGLTAMASGIASAARYYCPVLNTKKEGADLAFSIFKQSHQEFKLDHREKKIKIESGKAEPVIRARGLVTT